MARLLIAPPGTVCIHGRVHGGTGHKYNSLLKPLSNPEAFPLLMTVGSEPKAKQSNPKPNLELKSLTYLVSATWALAGRHQAHLFGDEVIIELG